MAGSWKVTADGRFVGTIYDNMLSISIPNMLLTWAFAYAYD